MTLFPVYLTRKIYINIQAIFGILSADDGLKGELLYIEKQCCCTQDTHVCSYNYNQNFILTQWAVLCAKSPRLLLSMMYRRMHELQMDPIQHAQYLAAHDAF